MSNKILFIDDDPDIVGLVGESLKDAGFDFISADTGEEGISLIKSQKPDLVILDMNLPDIMGSEICKRIKEDEELSSIPVIILTGKYMSAEDKVKGLNGGADDYILKPFEIPELIARVKVILSVYNPLPEAGSIRDYLKERKENKEKENK